MASKWCFVSRAAGLWQPWAECEQAGSHNRIDSSSFLPGKLNAENQVLRTSPQEFPEESLTRIMAASQGLPHCSSYILGGQRSGWNGFVKYGVGSTAF